MNPAPTCHNHEHTDSKTKRAFGKSFPGQWVTPSRTKTLFTGLSFLDHGFTRGLARQRISAWVGPASCGKTSLLRSIISHWLACGFHIVYIDAENNLLANDFICFEERRSSGKFWMVKDLQIVRRGGDSYPPVTDKNLLWSAETLIRSNIFDVVIIDLNTSQSTSWRSNKVYARWQNSLSKSKTALLLLTDNNHLPQSWNFYTRLEFSWAANVQYSEGLLGKTMILPSINCHINKDGLAQNTEVPITAHVTNRLFTHSPAADRRCPQT